MGFNYLYPKCLKKALLLWKYIYTDRYVYKYFYF